MRCSKPGCKEEVKNHKWAMIRAHDDGWFSQKDGTIWCPKHIPDWVEAWRKKKK